MDGYVQNAYNIAKNNKATITANKFSLGFLKDKKPISRVILNLTNCRNVSLTK